MIDFLKKEGVSDTTIQILFNNCSESVLYSLECNEIDCIKTIQYMKSIGIKNIEELMLVKIELFILSFEKVKEAFEKYNIKEFIDLLNNDISTIELIYNNL